MTFISKLFRESACIKMGPSFAVLMDQPTICKLGPAQFVQFRKFVISDEISNSAQEIIRIGWTTRNSDYSFFFQNLWSTTGTGWIRFSRRNPSPGGTRTYIYNCPCFISRLLDNFYKRPAGYLTINTTVFCWNTPFNYQDKFTLIFINR